MVRWVVDVDLAELFVPFQRSHDSTVRKDVIDRKATKVQFDSGVRVGHGSGIGYDLQKSEVTYPLPLRRRRGSMLPKGVALPQSAVSVP